jgi:lysophospholipase L1-like esterase
MKKNAIVNPRGDAPEHFAHLRDKFVTIVAFGDSITAVNHHTHWTRSMLSSCVGDLVQLMNDPIHPNAIGHRRFYHELAPLFNAHRNFFYEWERILRHEGEIS